MEILYVVDINWINCWKKYSDYNAAIKYLEKIENKFNSEQEFKNEIKEICDNMVLTGEITNSENYKPGPMDNESFGNNFIHKLELKLEDFDSLVDEETFTLLKKIPNYSFNSKAVCLKGMILDKIIILLIEKERKMKFIFNDEKSNDINLLQITADFTQSLGIKPFNIYGYFPDYCL